MVLRQCGTYHSPAGGLIDTTVNYLRHRAEGLNRFPRRVRVPLRADLSKWPSTCPREEGVQVQCDDWVGEAWEYSFTNGPSGKDGGEFRLQIFSTDASFDHRLLLLFG